MVNTVIDHFLSHKSGTTDISSHSETWEQLSLFSDVILWYSFRVNCSSLKIWHSIILWILKLELYCMPFNLFADWDCNDLFYLQSNKPFIDLWFCYSVKNGMAYLLQLEHQSNCCSSVKKQSKYVKWQMWPILYITQNITPSNLNNFLCNYPGLAGVPLQ